MSLLGASIACSAAPGDNEPSGSTSAAANSTTELARHVHAVPELLPDVHRVPRGPPRQHVPTAVRHDPRPRAHGRRCVQRRRRGVPGVRPGRVHGRRGRRDSLVDPFAPPAGRRAVTGASRRASSWRRGIRRPTGRSRGAARGRRRARPCRPAPRPSRDRNRAGPPRPRD